jgi:hypothetical protein
MDETYVGSPGQRGEIRQIAVVNAFFAERGFSPCAKLRFGASIPMGKPPTGEPCAGELHARFGGRAFSGTSEHEIAIGIPATALSKLTEYLFQCGGRQNMGLPLKPLLSMGLTDSITPGFQYLREIVDSKKDR